MIFPITDMLVGLILFLLLLNGASQGFLLSAIGPAALTLSALVSWLIFVTTKNIGFTVLSGLLAPFLFGWFLKTVINLFAGKDTPVPSLTSRIGGAVLSMGWGAPLIIGTLLIIVFFPLQNEQLLSARQDIYKSFSYNTLSKALSLPDPRKNKTLTAEEKKQAIKEITKDLRFQAALRDPELRTALENKDFAKILSNPLIQQMSVDPAFMLKALQLTADQDSLLSSYTQEE